ncbi:MAG: hypothetical protein AAF624_00590 [Bacteroidota bacterium]
MCDRFNGLGPGGDHVIARALDRLDIENDFPTLAMSDVTTPYGSARVERDATLRDRYAIHLTVGPPDGPPKGTGTLYVTERSAAAARATARRVLSNLSRA